MASDLSNGASDLSAPRPHSQSKAKVKQRKAKRHGPPQLQFLTATDPSQFKDESVKRSVRSQAMAHYRNKKPDKDNKGSPEAPESAQAGKETVVCERTRPIAVHEQHLLNFTLETAEPQVLGAHPEDLPYTYPSTSAAWWRANPSPERVIDTEEPDYPPPSTQRFSYDIDLTKPQSKAPTKVVKYEHTESHADLQMRLLVGKLARTFSLGDGVDPFMVLPQFKSPELSSIFLLRRCVRAFSTDSTMVKWLPGMLSHPHIILSAPVLASTWIDMHAGYSGDSKRTALAKAETIGMINERLRDPDLNLDDSTLIVILHLLAGEMWSCNEKILRIHESGVARFIAQRGGLQCLEHEILREIAAAVCYQCDIYCETAPLPIFHDWEPPQYTLSADFSAIPESPLFCPRSEFATIVTDPQCSQSTLSLLYDMRNLTNLFITHRTKLDASFDIDVGETASLSSPVDYAIKITEICERLTLMPSAYTPGLPTSNDWVYEACRITALIYTASISMRIPFFVAADPAQNPLLFHSRGLPASHAGGHLLTTRLNEELYAVLGRTDTSNIWNDMPGVLYWVCAVGAAASRTPATLNITQRPRSRSESYAMWVRRCLTMFATRTMIILVFQYPLSVIMAQRQLLEVQELIRTGPTKRFVS